MKNVVAPFVVGVVLLLPTVAEAGNCASSLQVRSFGTFVPSPVATTFFLPQAAPVVTYQPPVIQQQFLPFAVGQPVYQQQLLVAQPQIVQQQIIRQRVFNRPVRSFSRQVNVQRNFGF